MKIVEIYNTSNSYDVKGVNASLSLRKSGYKVFYDRNDAAIEKVPVEMSDEDVIEIVNSYLEKFNELLPPQCGDKAPRCCGRENHIRGR
ncbi:MAG: hypothetical protein J7L63_05960 [Thermoplasmata archaeon]|nr:hypothetical protein [Thermoplasmata archaeon]